MKRRKYKKKESAYAELPIHTCVIQHTILLIRRFDYLINW
jgi:hypothetical protein